MEPSLHRILDELSSRVNLATRTMTSKLNQTSSSPQDLALLGHLPGDLLDSYNTILGLFEQTESDKQLISNELFQTYTILNTAFDTTMAVANCPSARLAIETLCKKMTQSISTAYAFIIGPLASQFDMPVSLTGTEVPLELHIANLTTPDEIAEPGMRFVRAHAGDILQMYRSDDGCTVRMIDYRGKDDLDHDGRGNAMLVHLSGTHRELAESALLFIRRDDQEPFVAIEMNLANSLSRMCSSVMANIIYSEKLKQSFLQTISSLVRAMEAKDAYTSGHSNRVSDIACQLGRRLGYDQDRIDQLQWAGLLHDVGKIGIHEDILCKPGRLTDEEFAIIKTHPEKSYSVLEPVEALKEVLPAVRHHHEHFDGSGYPARLAGEDIPLIARIIQVADIWDALTSTRSYRKAMPSAQAIAIFHKESGSTMDPHLVEVFLEMLEEHPEWLPEESDA